MKTRIIALAFAAALMAASMTGCGLSEEGKHAQSLLNALPETYSAENDAQLEEARAAYDALPDEEKEKVDKSALDALEQSMIDQYAVSINEKIAALEVTVGSGSDVKKMHGNIKEIFEEIEKAPRAVDAHIDYDTLAGKMAKEFEKLNDIANDLAKDSPACVKIMELATLLNGSSSRTSVLYGYCNDIQTQINKMSGNVSTYSLQKAVDDLQDDLLYDEISAIMGRVTVYQEVDKLSDKVVKFYEPYKNADDMREELSQWTDVIAERG